MQVELGSLQFNTEGERHEGTEYEHEGNCVDSRGAPVFLDRTETLKSAVDAVCEAAETGALLIVFPEAFVPGYPRVLQSQLFLVQYGGTEMRIERNFVQYQSEARAMRARYIGDLLTRGCDAVIRVFSSAVHLLKRTLITASRNPGSLAKR